MSSPRGVAVLGSTGSIGRSTLAVLRRQREHFRVVALTAGKNVEEFDAQVAEWRPAYAGLAAGADGGALSDGPDVLLEAATHPDVDIVVNAVVGAAGLDATARGAPGGQAGGAGEQGDRWSWRATWWPRPRAPAAASWCRWTPSTAPCSSASPGGIPACARLILTCSGGPFREWPAERVAQATVEEALRHPTWQMGSKITVDSATLANKALELIEAHHLFGLAYDALEVVVHPQSIVHAFVEFCDGSVMAQLGFPSMELPILYALTHPARLPDERGAPVRSGGRRPAHLRAGADATSSARSVAGLRPGGRAGSRRRCSTPPTRWPSRRSSRARSPSAASARSSRACSTIIVRLPPPRSRPCARPTGGRASAPAPTYDAPEVIVLTTVLSLIVVLGVLVFVHEAGHFIAAKWAGIYVHRFSLGLGAPIQWLTFRRGETEYSISWLPLGGYVKMASREEDVGSSPLEGGAAGDRGAARPDVRGQADLEADGRDPGRASR